MSAHWVAGVLEVTLVGAWKWLLAGRPEYRLWSLLSKSDVYSRKGYLTKQLGDSQNTTRLSYEVSAYRERHIHRQGIRLSYKKNPKQLQATTQREQGTTARNNKSTTRGPLAGPATKVFLNVWAKRVVWARIGRVKESERTRGGTTVGRSRSKSVAD
jgi:hypothetical protein